MNYECWASDTLLKFSLIAVCTSDIPKMVSCLYSYPSTQINQMIFNLVKYVWLGA